MCSSRNACTACKWIEITGGNWRLPHVQEIFICVQGRVANSHWLLSLVSFCKEFWTWIEYIRDLVNSSRGPWVQNVLPWRPILFSETPWPSKHPRTQVFPRPVFFLSSSTHFISFLSIEPRFEVATTKVKWRLLEFGGKIQDADQKRTREEKAKEDRDESRLWYIFPR